MIAGHYATALVPYELTRQSQRTSFWVFLLAAQALDLAMLVFVQLGIERLNPENFFDFAFASSSSDMWVTHDILPSLAWAVAIGLLFWAATRKHVVALWCGALVFIHESCDLVVGYTHYWHGQDSMALGFNLYNEAPSTGLFIEAALCAAIVAWFCLRRAKSGNPVSSRLKWGLYAVLVGASLATLPIATRSVNAWLGL